MWFGLSRRVPYGDYNSKHVFTGPVDTYALNPATSDALLHSQDWSLWYFNYIEHKLNSEQIKTYDGSVLAYLGVLDIDLVFANEVEKVEFQMDPGEHPLVMELAASFIARNLIYEIWFSGSKGLHVYLYDASFLVKFDSKASMQTEYFRDYFKALDLPVEADLCIYAFGKGIRPTNIANPKTGLVPRLLLSNNTASINIHDYVYSLIDRLAEQLPSIHFVGSEISNPGAKNEIDASNQSINVPDLELDSISAFIPETELAEWSPINGHERTYKCSSTWCLIKGAPHKTAKTWIKIDKDEQHAYYRCFSAQCSGTDNAIVFKKQTVPVTKFFTAEDGLEVVQLKSERYLDIEQMNRYEDFQTKKVMIIAAGMGCGKTTWLQNLLETKKQKFRRVLVVASRICQVWFYKGLYPDFDVYLESKQQCLFDSDKLIVCLNSLMRVLANDGTVPYYDLIILDEMQALVNSQSNTLLSSSHKTDQLGIYKVLKLLIAVAGRTIMLDGLFESSFVTYLKETYLINLSCCYWHTGQTDNNTYCFLQDAFHFENIFKKKLREKKKIFLVTNAKTSSFAFSTLALRYINSSDIFLINGDSDDEIKQSLHDTNSIWKEKTLVIYNNALGPGINFDVPVYFDAGFGFFTCSSGTSVEMYQLIKRVRSIGSEMVYCYVGKRETEYFDEEALLKGSNIDKVKHYGLQKVMNLGLQQDNCLHVDLDLSVDNSEIIQVLTMQQRLRVVYEPDDFTRIVMACRKQSIHDSDSQRFTKRLVSLMRRNGAIVITSNEASGEEHQKYMQLQRKSLNSSSSSKFLQERLSVLQPEDREWLIDLLHLQSNPDAQTNFMAVWLASKNIEESYKREILQRFSGSQALCTVLQVPALSMHLRNLFEFLGFRLQNNIYTGSVPAIALNDNRPKIQEILEEMKRICFSSRGSQAPRINLKAVNISTPLKCMLAFLGFKLYAYRLGRHSYYTLDEQVQKARLAYYNIDFNTGEKTDNLLQLIRIIK